MATGSTHSFFLPKIPLASAQLQSLSASSIKNSRNLELIQDSGVGAKEINRCSWTLGFGSKKDELESVQVAANSAELRKVKMRGARTVNGDSNWSPE
jgi:hypothetical protein